MKEEERSPEQEEQKKSPEQKEKLVVVLSEPVMKSVKPVSVTDFEPVTTKNESEKEVPEANETAD